MKRRLLAAVIGLSTMLAVTGAPAHEDAPAETELGSFGPTQHGLALGTKMVIDNEALFVVFRLKNKSKSPIKVHTGFAWSGHKGFGMQLRKAGSAVRTRVFDPKTGKLAAGAKEKACPTDAPVYKTLAAGATVVFRIRESYTPAQLSQLVSSGQVDSFRATVSTKLENGTSVPLFVETDSFP